MGRKENKGAKTRKRNTDYMIGAFHCIRNMYDKESFCDLVLYIVGHSVKVHRMVMAAFSPILAQRLMKAPMAHDGFFHVHLDDLGLKPAAMEALVKFLYHGPKSPMACDAASVMECAHTLQVEIVVNYITDLFACNGSQGNKVSTGYARENELPSPFFSASDEIQEYKVSPEHLKENEILSPISNTSDEIQKYKVSTEHLKENEIPSPICSASDEIQEYKGSTEHLKENEILSPISNTSDEIQEYKGSTEHFKENEIPSSFCNTRGELQEYKVSTEHSSEDKIPSPIFSTNDEIHADIVKQVHNTDITYSESRSFNVCGLDSNTDSVETRRIEIDSRYQTIKEGSLEQELDNSMEHLTEMESQGKNDSSRDKSSRSEVEASGGKSGDSSKESSEIILTNPVDLSRSSLKVRFKESEPPKRRRKSRTYCLSVSVQKILDRNRTLGEEDTNTKPIRYEHFIGLLKKAREELSKGDATSGEWFDHNNDLQCPHCQTLFQSIPDLIEHIVREKHPRLEILPYPKIIENKGSTKWGCEVCPREFNSFSSYLRHFDWHQGTYHIIKNSRKFRPKKCRYCEKTFVNNPIGLRMHEAIHTGEKPLQCSYCGKTFRHPNTLRGHQRLHTGEKPYQCDKCDAAYASSSGWKNHMIRKHSERNFICEICGEAYFSSADLNLHKQGKHTKGRPFVCECTATFRTSRELQRHKTRSCKLRAGIVAHGQNQVVRKLSGKNHVCDVCDKAFFLPLKLEKHMQTEHPKERLFVCECAVTFSTETGLSEHKRESCNLRTV